MTHSHGATWWEREVTTHSFLRCPKAAEILRLVRRPASGDTVATAPGPELRGRARARSTLLAALIGIVF